MRSGVTLFSKGSTETDWKSFQKPTEDGKKLVLSSRRFREASFSRQLGSISPVERGEEMHNQRDENSSASPRETERLNGELEIDYQRNRVTFHPNALREFTFSLPLTPSDIDVVRSLAEITRRLETHSLGNYI
jgi:hypothetical protein